MDAKTLNFVWYRWELKHLSGSQICILSTVKDDKKDDKVLQLGKGEKK